MQQFDRIKGRFNPLRRDNLKAGVEQLIGWEGWWLACWLNDEDDNYPGEWAMQPIRHRMSAETADEWRKVHALWVPLCDIEVIEELGELTDEERDWLHNSGLGRTPSKGA